jgi:Zn-dependent protease/CBS domain-containing protein
MNRSWKIATIRGIPIRIHFTHPILLLYITVDLTRNFAGYYANLMHRVGVTPQPSALPPLIWGIAIAIGFVSSIVLHELSHCAVAQAYGVRVQSITLMGLGGVSQMEALALSPGREAWMAIAGPLMSFAIGSALYAVSYFVPIRPNELRAAGLLLGQINTGLGIFNLIPAFPMDGGRLLRAGLTRWLGRLNATRAAAIVGMFMAVLFCVAAFLLPQPLLALIALFIVFGAWTETAAVERTMLQGKRVGGFADPRIERVTPETPLADVIERFRRGHLAAVRVGDGVTGPGAGYITRADLARVGWRPGSRRAGDIARRDILRVWASADAAAVAIVMKERGKEAVVVDQDTGEPVGLVTRADLARKAARADMLGDAVS